MRLHPARIGLLFSFVLLVLASSTLHAVDPAKNLSPRFQHWINEEVPYIIESEERKQFLSLTSDAERDNFIKLFWDARNPNPGSEFNDYKDEHYRRLAYANQYFGNIKAQDGWRTDQGRIYITLGPPEQKANYPSARNLRPILIWFYQSKTPALPTHFNILFYKRSIGEEYTLYSPYQDGPSRLVTGLEGKNVQNNNLDIIKRSLGDEVARTTISLIPTEPVNLSDYSPSLQSDVLLSNIKGLADNPLNKELIARRKMTNEHVTTSVFFGSNIASLQAAAFRDSAGRGIVYSLLSYERPEAAIVGQMGDKRLGYSLTLQTNVLTTDGRSIYQQNEKLTGVVSENQATLARGKRFGAESRIPLAPGEYQLVMTLTNDLNHSAVRQQTTVEVPDPTKSMWGISKIVVFSAQPPVHDASESLPFSLSGLRFVPKGVQQISVHAGEPVRVVFQLWSKPADPATREGHKIKIHYVYGTMQGGQSPHQEDEEIDATSFDASGTLLTGRTLSTEGLASGNYRAVITATDETTQQKTFGNFNFRVTGDTEVTDMWTAYDANVAGPRGQAIDDYKRGLSASMHGQSIEAISWFQRSLNDDPKYTPAFERLVDLLSQSGRYADISALSKNYPVDREVPKQTAIQLSQAIAHAGDYTSATHILEYELEFQPPSADLYLALANVYQMQGNASRANEYKQQAAKLSN